jgi:bacterial/archaeal transporter family-2 protein
MKREATFLYSAAAPLVGAVITLMTTVNSRFSAVVGNLVATLVIHVAGLAAVSAVLLLKREKAQPGRLPAYYYLGGFIGVGTVFSSIYAFTVLGAALAVALALLGQTLCSIIVDAAGFLGRPRYPLTVRRLPGILLAIAGVAVMSHAVDIGIGGAAGPLGAAGWHLDPVAVLVALVAGSLPAITFSLNSELGRRKGMVRSTRVNYVVGLATTLVIVAVVRPPVVETIHAVVTAGPLLALGGGFLGVVVVTSMNFIFPRIPALSATLLLYSGQALMGVLVDIVAEGAFDARKLVGAIILLLGLATNALLARRRFVAA